jgi:WD40 repeat protein
VLTGIGPVAFSPDGHVSYTYNYHGAAAAEVIAYRTISGKSARVRLPRPTTVGAEIAVGMSRKAEFFGLALSPNGRELAVVERCDKGVTLLDTETAERVGTLPLECQLVTALRFSPDGRLLAALGREAEITEESGKPATVSRGEKRFLNLWDVPARRALATIEVADEKGAMRYFPVPVFSADGLLLAHPVTRLADPDREEVDGHFQGVCVRQARTGEEVVTHKMVANQFVRFLDGGKTLVGVSQGNRRLIVQICNVETGAVETTVRHQWGGFVGRGAIAYSPRAELLAAAAPDHCIDLWHVRTGRKIATLRGPDYNFSRYVYVPDAQDIAPLVAGRPLKFSDDGSRFVALAMFGKPWRPGEYRFLDKDAEIKATVWNVARFTGSGNTSQEEPLLDDSTPVTFSGTAGKSPAGSDTSPYEVGTAKVVHLRTWTSADGRYRVRAKLIDREGDNVVLTTENGRTIRVGLDKLSRADRAYIRVIARLPEE